MPAGNTYEAIATQTLGSAAASVTFSSIPSTFTDLVFVVNAMGASASQYQRLQVNGDTGSNYSRTGLAATGSSVYSYRDTNLTTFAFVGQSTLSTTPSNTAIVNLQNYSNTTTYKTFLARIGNAVDGSEVTVGLWRSTAAINSVVFSPNTGNYSTGSTFSLYGIKAA
jgi:hypothetical protein